MTQEPAASSPFDPLTRVGINIQLGLEYCVGEADFYTEMLQLFCSQGPEKRDEIASLYEAANWKDYAIKVHALKSTSLTIGAEALSEQAKQLELAGKAEDVEYIRQNQLQHWLRASTMKVLPEGMLPRVIIKKNRRKKNRWLLKKNGLNFQFFRPQKSA